MRFYYLLILLISNFIFAQTNIGGGIYSDKILKQSESPYIVSSNLVIFPEITLTVEPGVEIRFNDGISLEIRGNLFALGSAENRIKFTGATKTIGSWAGLNFQGVNNSKSGFDFCDFEYATYNYLMSNYSGSLYFKNSKFYKNLRAIAMFTSFEVPIDNCIFDSNDYGITSINKKVSNCTFTNNKFGIGQTAYPISIYNSTFSNNTVAINGYGITLDNSTIVNNSTGLDLVDSNMNYITNCTISNNTVGISIAAFAANNWQIKSNKICNNLNYNVRLGTQNNVNLKENCWCTKDKPTIDHLIYDGYDDTNLGLVSYDIYEDDCITKLDSQETELQEKTEIYPNPFSSDINIKLKNDAKKITLSIFSLDGKQVSNMAFEKTSFINSTLKNLSSGTYILNINIDGKNISRKIVKK
ncbi:hypothetical protein D3C87_495120 [compost metagenome]